ncbi:MAG: 50S ribosomal protein L3 [Candidatus Colwellbacteria bacterium]|nr:50S ribosomal protein L3 [Candidatus Colwellbacteria bacterium]
MQFAATKIKMTQVVRGEEIVPVTAVQIGSGEGDATLAEGDLVRVVGRSRGKGFQGVVKRHGFHGGPKTHGQKDRHRGPGTAGPTHPQKVIKGRRMAGRTGGDRVTVKNVKVVEWREEPKIALLKGQIPGYRGSAIRIYKP